MLRLGLDFPSLASLASVVTATRIDKIPHESRQKLAFLSIRTWAGEAHPYVEVQATDGYVLAEVTFADDFRAGEQLEDGRWLVPATLIPEAMRAAKVVPARQRRRGNIIAHLEVDSGVARIIGALPDHPFGASADIDEVQADRFPDLERLKGDQGSWPRELPTDMFLNPETLTRALKLRHPSDVKGEQPWNLHARNHLIVATHQSERAIAYICESRPL